MIGLNLTLAIGLTPEALGAAIQRGHERAMVEIAAELLRAARATIETGVDPWGEPWAPHDPDTRSPTGRIGYRTGALLASLVATPTEPTPGLTRAEVTSTLPYAPYFQGRRPILPLTFDRGFTARGRRSARREERVDMPPAMLAKLIEIDERHVMASVEEARAAANARPTEV